MKIFDGQKTADKIASQLKHEASNLIKIGIHPKLAILSVDPDHKSQAYIQAKQLRGKQIGIDIEVIKLDDAYPDSIKAIIEQYNRDPSTHGIIIQLPLPPAFNTDEMIDVINPKKDVDGLTSTNADKITSGLKPFFYPATPLAIREILIQNKIDIGGKKIAIIGQGRLVGKPLASMLKNAGAQISTADKNTGDIASITKPADIIISAVGSPHLITADMVSAGAIIIDVGISKQNNRQIGDVDFNQVRHKAGLITPTIGGVGPMTVVMLMKNVMEAIGDTKEQSKK